MTQEIKTRATFPSVQWFDALRNLVNSDEGYRRIGTCDALVGIKIPDLQKCFLLTFEAFECTGAREAKESDLESADFWLEASYEKWKEIITNIRENGKADLHHTLNTIDLEDPEGFARSRDGYKRDAFYRFNQTFQYFFDSSAKMETTFQ